MKTSELASQRIAFEEEKLAQETVGAKVQDSEAELLRHKLKEQVSCFSHTLVGEIIFTGGEGTEEC